jgi:hypothetical protein
MSKAPESKVSKLFPGFKAKESYIVLFRFKVDGTTDYVGLIQACDERSLYWGIDEIGDPNSAEIKRIRIGEYLGICFKVTPPPEISGDDGSSFEDPELMGNLGSLLTEDIGWVTPIWSEEVNKGH